MRHDLAVDPRLPDPTGDELRVLGTEVDDEDGPVDLLGEQFGGGWAGGKR